MNRITSSRVLKAFIGIPCILAVTMFSLYSFTVKKAGADFLSQLGLSKTEADQKLANGFLDGSVNTYGIKNLQAIAIGSRTALTKDILAYARNYTVSEPFLKQYNAMRDRYKPKTDPVQTPDEMREGQIAAARKGLANIEASLKKADASSKAMFEKLVEEMKQQVAQAEDPNNKQYVHYKQNYPQLVKDMESRQEYLLKRWEEKYPSNPSAMVKQRLQDFMKATSDVDYSAALVTKNGKKYFENPAYEKMDRRWKMAYRAGKEVVEPAREFVQQWISDLP